MRISLRLTRKRSRRDCLAALRNLVRVSMLCTLPFFMAAGTLAQNPVAVVEQDFTNDGTPDLRIDNGIMWIQINRDDPTPVKGFIDEGGLSGVSNFLRRPIAATGMVDQTEYWATTDFSVTLLEDKPERVIALVSSTETGNGKEITKKYTITLEAGVPNAWAEYEFTNTGSSSFSYDEYPSHLHNGAHVAALGSIETADIEAYVNGIGNINLTSQTFWRSYSPDAVRPFAVLYKPSSGLGVTLGFKSFDHSIDQIVSYYTGTPGGTTPNLDFMASQFTLAPGESAQWSAVIAFHDGGYTRGTEIYNQAQEPSDGAGWCDGFEEYSPGSSVSSNWVLSGNSSAVADNSVAYSGNQSVKMFGSIGGCWATLANRPLEASYPLTLEFAVRNGTENLYGCHPQRATVVIRSGDHWTDPTSVSVLHFLENGELEIRGCYPYDTLSGYSLEHWYHFKVEVSVPDDGYVHLSYWVDGEYIGEYLRSISELPYLMEAAYLDLGAQEGTVWFDDVCVTPGTAAVPIVVDLKPGSWPNPLNVQASKPSITFDENDQPETHVAAKSGPGASRFKAVIPAAILGTGDFDVALIDPEALRLAGTEVLRWAYEDVSSPASGDPTECEGHEGAPDGYTDLTLKFARQAIIQALGEVYDGQQVPVTLTGNLMDGTPIEGADCFLIVNGEPPPITEGSGDLDLENYPNPFNPTTHISFTLPTASEVKLRIFNTLGQEVATVVDRYLEAGTHTYSWDGSSAASGIYLYRLTAGDFVETKKMMLLK